MNEKGFNHLDIKCENIYLDYNLTVKLGNFQQSEQNSQEINTFKGSPGYQAPEICYRKFPFNGEKADVFSLGVVLFAL